MITDINDYVSVTKMPRSKFGTGKGRAQNVVKSIFVALWSGKIYVYLNFKNRNWEKISSNIIANLR